MLTSALTAPGVFASEEQQLQKQSLAQTSISARLHRKQVSYPLPLSRPVDFPERGDQWRCFLSRRCKRKARQMALASNPFDGGIKS